MSNNIADIYALTPIQMGIVFHCLQDLRPGLYCGQVVLMVEGELDEKVYQQAWQRTVDRHPVFRTLFLSDLPDQPLQVVLKAVELPFEFYDWRAYSAEQQGYKTVQMLEKERRKGFDLRQAPLSRITVLRMEEQDYRIIWNQHHAVLDGWSVTVVLREVEIQYHALKSGKHADLASSRPFKEFVEYLDRRDQRSAAKFWRAHLRGFEGPTSLASLQEARQDGSENLQAFGEVGLRLSPECTSALVQKAHSGRVTVNTMIQAAWAVLLSRCTGNDRVIFGVTFAGRPPEFDGVESAVGIFINTLPLQVEISEDMRLEQFLRILHEKHFGMSEFQNSALTDVQTWAGHARAEGLFESIIVFQDMPEAGGVNPGVLQHQLVGAHETTNYPFALLVSRGNVISLRAVFDGRRFEPSNVEAILKYLGFFLEEMTDPGDRPISELELLRAVEREQLLRACNHTERKYAGADMVHELFEEQVKRTPETIAVVHETEQLSYAELNRQANRLAHYLRRRAVGCEAPVGVCLERSPGMIAVLLGIMKAGGTYVPLDPEYPQQRLAYMLRDSEVRLLITQQSLKHRLKLDGVASVVAVTVEELQTAVSVESQENPRTCVTGQNLAYVIYTSGSTGEPQGVAIEHRSAATMLRWAREVFAAEELSGVLASTSICFDLSVFEIFVPLAWGGKVIIARNALELRDAARRHEVKLVNTVPSAMAALLRSGDLPASVKTVNLAGELLSEGLVEEIYRQKQVERVWDLYGPSEDTTYSTFALRQVGEGANIGRPIANTQAYVLDKRMRIVPPGVRGELYLGGSGLARGYLRKPELTADRFVPNAFSNGPAGERLYRTGDVVCWRANGTLEYLGRADHQAKIRGFRVECGEVEAALNRHEGVESAVVVVREDSTGDKQLAVYWVKKAGVELEARALRAYMQQSLPNYMVPGHMILLPELPLTSNGKIDRNRLPPIEAAGGQPSASAPTVVRELIANIWAELLDRAHIGDHENFFDLGGHSIKIMQLVSRIREALEIDLPIRSIFVAPTLGEFSQQAESAIQTRAGQSFPALGKAQADGTKPLSFAQQRLWFLQRLAPDSSIYNIPIVLRLQGLLDQTALGQALLEIQRRHEILRTVFPMEMEGPGLRVLVQGCPLELLDLRGQVLETRRGTANAAVNDLLRLPFALEDSPAIRTLLVRLDETEYLLSVTLHHIVCDGWSVNIILREFQQLYNAFAEGKESPLPQLDVQYADYAACQRQRLQGDELPRQLQYWKEQLAGVPMLLDLPGANQRPSAQSHSGEMISSTLPDPLRSECYALSRRESSTVFMILLAAFAACLHEWVKKDEFLIGIDISNRHLPGTEQLIGLFINQIVLRANLAGDPTFIALIGRVRRTCLGAYSHQDAPFDKLVGSIADARTLRHNPLFQVMFGLQARNEETYQMKGITITPEAPVVSTSAFDLSFYMAETQTGFNIDIRYNTDLLQRSAIRRLVDTFSVFLQKATAEPEDRLSELMRATGQTARTQTRASNKLLQKQMLSRLTTAAPRRVRIHDNDAPSSLSVP